MTWEQKLEALNCLCEHVLIMRKPGDWYVSSNLHIHDKSVLIGEYGQGHTPQEAVEVHWDIYSNLAGIKKCVYVSEDNYVNWNGYMWKPVK
jgi:hypothetical protein